MFEAKQLQRHALECLRLQADCMQLAGVARSLNVQSHFVAMAQFWGALAALGVDRFERVPGLSMLALWGARSR